MQVDIANYEEFFTWARGPFRDALLPEENYDGSPIPTEKQRVATYNRVIGGLRIRQTRVTPNSGCSIGLNVQEKMMPTKGPDAGQERKRSYVKKCYSKYVAQSTWSRRPYGPMAQPLRRDHGPVECRALYDEHVAGTYSDAMAANYDMYEQCLGRGYWDRSLLLDTEANTTYREAGTNLTDPLQLAFTWQSAKANDLDGFERQLKYAKYDGSGFVVDLNNLTSAKLDEALDYLEENTWLDRQTRAIFVSTSVYNANFNLVAVINFELELSLAGVLIPVYSLQAITADLYRNMLESMGHTIFVVVEIILYLGMLFYLFNEFREVYDIYQATGSPIDYFKDFWNLIDWSLIGLSFASATMRVSFMLRPEIQAFTPFSDRYLELTRAANIYNDSFSVDAIAATFGIRPEPRTVHRSPCALRAPCAAPTAALRVLQASSRSFASSTCRRTCSCCASRSRAAWPTSPSSPSCCSR